MSKIIKFINTINSLHLEKPEPASSLLPDWYKNTDSYIGGKKVTDGNANTFSTIKRCIPVFDIISAGYIILSPADVMVSIKNGQQYFEWADFDLIKFHPIEQAQLHPSQNGYAYPKWTNPWGIKTPKGYSVLINQPFHRESVFTILPGIVDTDTYFPPINFPFVINDKNFEGLIPKGTPIAQVIPFKRDSWKHELGNEEDFKEQFIISGKLRTRFFDRYKSMFWTRKEYK